MLLLSQHKNYYSMKKEKLDALSIEQLKKKEKGYKAFIVVFIPIIIGLFFSVIKDYINGVEMDFAILTIAICSLGGPATMYPELKEVQKEIKKRTIYQNRQ